LIDLLQVDPSKLADKAQQLPDNVKRLSDTSQQFLNAILNSLDFVPLYVYFTTKVVQDLTRLFWYCRPFRVMCFHLRAEVSQKFPKHKHAAVAGFIFLRFFCAAVMAPFAYKLTEGISIMTLFEHRNCFLYSGSKQRSAESPHTHQQGVAKCCHRSGIWNQGTTINATPRQHVCEPY
jgi:hypothetical protein